MIYIVPMTLKWCKHDTHMIYIVLMTQKWGRYDTHMIQVVLWLYTGVLKGSVLYGVCRLPPRQTVITLPQV